MDAIEAALGRTLLAAVGLAVIQLALIVLLLEANLIMRLAGRLICGLRTFGADRGVRQTTNPPAHGEPVTVDERN